MKYVMLQAADGRLMPVIFPNELVHSDIAGAVSNAVAYAEMQANVEHPSFLRPVSAGFLQVLVSGTDGHSETLRMKSLPSDARVINCHDYSHGRETGMEALIEAKIAQATVENMLSTLEGVVKGLK